MDRARSLASRWTSFTAAIADDARSLGQDEARTRRAVATGIATALAIYVALLLNLDYPMWSGMTALTVTAATVRATLLKGAMRAVGTIGAAAVAIVLLGFIAGSEWTMLAALFVTVAYALYRSFTSVYPYAWLLGGITIGLILMDAMASPTSGLHIAAYRAAEILVGVISAFAVGILLLPPASDPAHDRALAVTPNVERSLAARTAIEAATGICVVVVAYALFNLPGFASAAVSLTRMVDPNPELGRHRGFLRVIGCGVGGGLGLAMVSLSIDQLAVYLLLIGFFCSIFGYVFAGRPASAYAGMQAGFAFIIAFAPTTAPTATLSPAIDRFAGIILAFVVFWAIDLLFAAAPPAPAASPTDAAASPRPSGETAVRS